MDIGDVITLAVQAASSVLRFRAIAFGSVASIEFKSFTHTIKISVRKLAKDHNFSDDMPLACVVEFTGTAAFRAAKKWNSIAEKPNRVDCEWFRHSITTLVSGVVSEIGHQAHYQLQTTDPFDFSDEYLDPQGNDDDTTSSVELHTPPAKRRSSRLADTANYYGFEPAEAHAAEDRIAIQLAQPLLPRHQLTEGWRAISKYAADPLSYTAAAECEGTIAALVQPRETIDDGRPESPGSSEMNDGEEDEGGEEEKEEQDSSEAESEVRMMPVAKRQRVSERLLSPTVAPSRSSSPVDRAGPSNGESKPPSPGTNDQARNRVPWTKEEERLLVQLRDNGEDWTVIHRRLNRSSRGACQTKYYSLQDKRKAHGAGNEMSGSPSGRGSHDAQRMPRV